MTEFDSVILPGGEGKVVASIDTSRFSGRVTKSVTVRANDPDNPTVRLTLSADIQVPIEVRPRDRVFFRGKIGDVEPQELLLVEQQGQPFDVLSLETNEDVLEVKVSPAPEEAVKSAAPEAEKAGTEAEKAGTTRAAAGQGTTSSGTKAVAGGHAAYRVSFALKDGAPAGRVSDRVRIATSHPKVPTIDVIVSGRLEGPIDVRPARVYLMGRPEAGSLSRSVRVKSEKGGLEIRSVESSHPRVEASVKPVTEGVEYEIDVSVATADIQGSQLRTTVVVTTNDPRQPKIEIPVVARPQQAVRR